MTESMPTIQTNSVEGGPDGLVVESRSRQSINLFFSIGVLKIQEEMNRLAKIYVSEWKLKTVSDFMIEFGLPHTTYSEGINELQIPYALFEPTNIVLDIIDSSYPLNKLTPACQSFLASGNNSSLVRIFLRALRIHGSDIELIDNSKTAFKCVVYHELIHACGDTPELRGIVDGVVRHTLIGCHALLNLGA